MPRINNGPVEYHQIDVEEFVQQLPQEHQEGIVLQELAYAEPLNYIPGNWQVQNQDQNNLENAPEEPILAINDNGAVGAGQIQYNPGAIAGYHWQVHPARPVPVPGYGYGQGAPRAEREHRSFEPEVWEELHRITHSLIEIKKRLTTLETHLNIGV